MFYDLWRLEADGFVSKHVITNPRPEMAKAWRFSLTDLGEFELDYYENNPPLPPRTPRQRFDSWAYTVRFFPGWGVMWHWNREGWHNHSRPVATIRTILNRVGLWMAL